MAEKKNEGESHFSLYFSVAPGYGVFNVNGVFLMSRSPSVVLASLAFHAASAAVVALGTAALTYGVLAPVPEARVVAVSWSGDEYVVAVADDCREAWRHTEWTAMPADWRSVSCEAAR